MVRMSNVSVPEPGEKIRLGARIIAAPTATRATATSAKIGIDAWAFSCVTPRPYSPCVFHSACVRGTQPDASSIRIAHVNRLEATTIQTTTLSYAVLAEQTGRMLACMSRLAADAPVLVRADGPVARLTLNRPEKRNALGLELMEELIARLHRLSEDPDVRVIVVDAVGPAFSGGHDLSEMIGRDVPFYQRLFDV